MGGNGSFLRRRAILSLLDRCTSCIFLPSIPGGGSSSNLDPTNS
jgi:hypothetical protein